MEGKISKRELRKLVIGIISLVVLTFGATYAYFQVAVSDTSGTTTITGDIGGGTLGTVTLTGGDTELYLGISPYDMSESKKGTTYYSSTTEGSRETSKGSAGKTTYTATLSGDDTNEVMYACDYEFTVSATGTMLGKDSTENVEVVFEGDINRTLQLSSSNTVRGIWYGFKESNKERSFNAYLQLTNTDSPQNDLAGTNASIEIENSKFECYLDKNDELIGEAYAIYTEDNQTLTFLRSETPISVGGTHNGETITKVYTGIEDTEYYLDLDSLQTNLPWFDTYIYLDGMPVSPIESVVFQDEIRPISTAAWFAAFLNLQSIDIEKLNTSLVTDMSSMFLSTPINNELDLSAWDTSNVTDMSYMFADVVPIGYNVKITGVSEWDVSNASNMYAIFSGATLPSDFDLSGWDVQNWSGVFAGTVINTNMGLENLDMSNQTDISGMFMWATVNVDLDLSRWDVSNVTDMSELFRVANINAEINLEDWDTSRVTDMSYMFRGSNIDKVSGLDTWDVSKVEDMLEMFQWADINSDMDLSNWNVSNVVDMSHMFFEAELTDIGDISGWDTGRVVNMSSMFNLEDTTTYEGSDFKFDLSGWNVSNVTEYRYFSSYDTITPPSWENLFFAVYSETDGSLRLYNKKGSSGVPNVNDNYNGRIVTKVVNVSSGQFGGFCSSWTGLNPTSIIAEDNIITTNTAGWFADCRKVNKIDLTNLDTRYVTNMDTMFNRTASDASVTTLSISGIENLDTSKVKSMSVMFNEFGINADYMLDLRNWNVSNVMSYTYFNDDVETKVLAPTFPKQFNQ